MDGEEILYGSVIAFIVALLIFVFGSIAGMDKGERTMLREAIDRGVAEYNQTTGEWQWKDLPCVETKEEGE